MTSVFKTILGGILAGAVVFFLGFFLLKVLLFFLVIGAIIRFFIRRRMRRAFPNGFKGFTHFKNGYSHATVIHIRRKQDENIINID